MFLKFIFLIVKCIFVSLKILDNSCFEIVINSIEIFLLTIVNNLVTYIKNKYFKDFTIEDVKDKFNWIKNITFKDFKILLSPSHFFCSV